MKVASRSKGKLGLAALALLQVLLSCDANSNGTVKPVASEEPTEGSEPLPIELSFVRMTEDDLILKLPGETLEDNRWTRLYEDELGIRIRYEWVSKGDLYDQKLGGALASGAIPDVVKVNAEQLRTLHNEGLIQELTEVYDQYASPFTKTILNQEGSAPFQRATIDGKLMAIPATTSSIEGAKYIWIRKDWLDRLELDPPRTMNDLLEISKAFTERDPDGNGLDDTYGFALTRSLLAPLMGISGLLAGYEAYPTMWLEDKDGQLVYGGIQPQMREALLVLQRLYKDGQIDPEFGFKNSVQEEKLIADGKIGLFYGEQWGSFLAQTSRIKEPDSDWQAYPIVSATSEPVRVPLPLSTYQYLAVRKDYPHPEALIKLLNLHLEKNWGETAEYEKYYSTPQPVWKLSPVTPYPALKNLEAFRQLEQFRSTGDRSVLKAEAKAIQKYIEIYEAGKENRDAGWGWKKTYGPDGAFSILEQYIRNDQLLYERFLGPPTSTMIEKQSVLYNLQIETYANIILGRPIEEFDRFVQDWNSLGGERMTREVNEWLRQSTAP